MMAKRKRAAERERRNLEEEGLRLASERDDLIAEGVDPAVLEVPLAPIAPVEDAPPRRRRWWRR